MDDLMTFFAMFSLVEPVVRHFVCIYVVECVVLRCVWSVSWICM